MIVSSASSHVSLLLLFKDDVSINVLSVLVSHHDLLLLPSIRHLCLDVIKIHKLLEVIVVGRLHSVIVIAYENDWSKEVVHRHLLLNVIAECPL